MTGFRLASFTLSILLHVALVAAALYWPEKERPYFPLNATIIEVSQYTIGAPGAPATAPARPQTPEAPKAPETPAASEPPVDVPQVPEPPQAPTPPESPPEKPVEPDKPAPPEAPKPEPKPEPKKPEPRKPDPKTVAQKAPPKRNATQKIPPSRVRKMDPDEVLRRALGDLEGSPPAPDSVADALKNLGSGQQNAGAGSGGTGDGVGILGTYRQSLVSRIRPHWEYAGRADRRNPVAYARIRIAADGTITSAEIEKSSGDPAFDGSVIKAIRDTERVEAPPSPDLADITLGFAYEALSLGR